MKNSPEKNTCEKCQTAEIDKLQIKTIRYYLNRSFKMRIISIHHVWENKHPVLNGCEEE